MKKYTSKDGCYLVTGFMNGNSILSWYIAEEDDLGGVFGETNEFDDAWEKAGYDACEAFVGSLGVDRAWKDTTGFIFQCESDAKRALSIVNAAILAARDSAPWPDWALTAVANGWKAPRGWKP